MSGVFGPELPMRKFILSSLLAGGLCVPSALASDAKLTTGSVAQYSSTARLAPALSFGGAVDIKPASTALKRGLAALDKDDVQAALVARKSLKRSSIEWRLLSWSIAMNGKGLDAATLSSIASQHTDWPGAKTIRNNIEKALERSGSSAALKVAFSNSAPRTFDAALALARAHMKNGHRKSARSVIAPWWRNYILDRAKEKLILKHAGKALLRSDHRARVEYLLSRRNLNAAKRIAGKAGVTRLVAARIAVERKKRNAAKALAAVPASQRKDANFILSKARYLRRADKVRAAGRLLLTTKAKSVHANARRLFATEQRIVASDLADQKDYKLAYRVMAASVAASDTRKMDAHFYAGFLALRKIGDAKTARRHFEKVLKIASTPISIARGAYWIARADEAAGRKTSAKKHYRRAAKYDTTYYGQLAARKLGATKITISKPRPSQTERARFPKYELVQALAKLESAGHPKRARVFYRHLGLKLERSGELALLAARAEKKGDFQTALKIGKTAFIRGRAVDTLAWPLGAIPASTRTGKAGLPLAYAISRQESTFQIDARSHANALGLMQLLPGTAKATARRAGVRYSKAKLTTDPGYNALLGTTYLGEQMDRFGGSLVLTFVAYNAGPSRAHKWVKRYGDPRGASLDFAVDWVEQIPFSETRNYVQRVMENYQVYKARLKGSKLSIDRDLVRGKSI